LHMLNNKIIEIKLCNLLLVNGAMKRYILNIALLYSICNTQFKDMSSYYPGSNESINQKDKTSPTKL